MPLTDAKVRTAKPADRSYKLPDFDGMHLFVTPTGIKSWRLRYRASGKEQTLVLGRYPEMGLADARTARDEARSALRAGKVPGQKEEDEAPPPPPPKPTFETAAREWHALNKPRWKPHHAADVLASLETEIFPAVGAVPIDLVTGEELLEALRVMERRGAIETARRVKQRSSQVFLYAMSRGWCANDPTVGLRAALAPLPAKGHRPAIVDLAEARKLVAALDKAPGFPTVKLAMRFLALTAARPGEVAGMLWEELAGTKEAPEWHIPPERTKITAMRARSAAPHIVPLAPAAVACLEAMRKISGEVRFVFPGVHSLTRPLSENALSYTLDRLGYKGRHVPHGWRSTFSSIMNERHPADRQVIDLMLAHKPGERVEAAYNRARHMPRRRELAELWADLLLEKALSPAEILAGPRRT